MKTASDLVHLKASREYPCEFSASDTKHGGVVCSHLQNHHASRHDPLPVEHMCTCWHSNDMITLHSPTAWQRHDNMLSLDTLMNTDTEWQYKHDDGGAVNNSMNDLMMQPSSH